MGRKYFCDYCDKSFPDNKQNRKKHMMGVQHDRKVKMHYFNYKDPAEILAEESKKKPCRTLHQNGHCDFHPLCRFSHLTPQWEKQLRIKIDLKYQAEEAKKRLEEQKRREKVAMNPTLDGWMSRRAILQDEGATTASDRPADSSESEERGSIFKMPVELRGRRDLPPSLIPPSLVDLIKAEDLDWG